MLVTDYIIEYLRKQENLSHIFLYIGGTNAPILNSIAHAKGVTYITHRHEEFASIAAKAYAMSADKLGVATSMSGPGATHMVTGIIDAWFDSIPTLYLTGQVTRGTYKFDNPSRQIGYQETDIISIVKSITKDAILEINEKEVPNTLRKLISKAKTLRQGPVLLDVPFDVLREDIPEDGLDIPAEPKSPPPINDIVVKAFLDLLAESKRPLLIIGGGVRTQKSRDLLIKFANTLKIPVVTSLIGKGSFPNDNPLYFGFIGAYGNRYANITMANCDLLIALGTRLDSRQTGNTKYFARAAKKVHVEIDRNEINNNVKVDLPIHGDIDEFMQKVLTAVEEADDSKYSEWMDYFKKVKKEFDVTKDYQGSEELVNPKILLQELSKQVEGPAMYVVDIGNNAMYGAQSLIVKEKQRFIVSGGLGTMGFALPGSIGAYYGAPKGSQIFAIMSDGGLQMSSQELETISHNNLPIKIIVLNNKVLGLMRVFQNENYDGVHVATEDGYSVPNLEKLAAAYDIKYKKVSTTEEAVNYVPNFIDEKGPILLEVEMHKDWTGYPKTRRGLPSEYQNPAISDEKLKEFMLIPLYNENK